MDPDEPPLCGPEVRDTVRAVPPDFLLPRTWSSVGGSSQVTVELGPEGWVRVGFGGQTLMRGGTFAFVGEIAPDLRQARFWARSSPSMGAAWGQRTVVVDVVDWLALPEPPPAELRWVDLSEAGRSLWTRRYTETHPLYAFFESDVRVVPGDRGVWVFYRRTVEVPLGEPGTYVQYVDASGWTAFEGVGEPHAEELRPIGGRGMTRTTSVTGDGGVWYVLDGAGVGEDVGFGLRAYHRLPDGRLDAVSEPLVETVEVGVRGPTDREHPNATRTYAEAAWGLEDDGLLVHVSSPVRTGETGVSHFVRVRRDGTVAWRYRTRAGWSATGDPALTDVRAVALRSGEVWALLSRVQEWDVHYVLKLGGDGEAAWAEDAVPYPVPPSYTGRVWEAELAGDGEGGVFVAVRTSGQVRLERLDETGRPRWTGDGLGVETGVHTNERTWLGQSLQLAPDGRGGVWLASGDVWRTGAYLQHHDAEGRPLVMGRDITDACRPTHVYDEGRGTLLRQPDGTYALFAPPGGFRDAIDSRVVSLDGRVPPR